MKAIEVTTGLAESNGSLPLGEWLKVPCGLTVQQDQPRAQFCGKTVTFTLNGSSQVTTKQQHLYNGLLSVTG